MVPLSDTDAAELVAASPVGELLAAEIDHLPPGAPAPTATSPGPPSVPLARSSLESLLVRVSALLEHVPELATLTANPVIAGQAGASFTDAWVRVAPHRPPTAPDVRRLD